MSYASNLPIILDGEVKAVCYALRVYTNQFESDPDTIFLEE